VAKTFAPAVPPELRDYIVEAYVDIRSRDKQRALERNSSATTTARQLLSILRLAEAHAKLNFSDVVRQDNVDEAIRLIQMSKASVLESDADLAKGSRSDPVSRIWTLVSPKLNSGFRACRAAAWRPRRPAPCTPMHCTCATHHPSPHTPHPHSIFSLARACSGL